ncbi:hypothetical protein CCHL11_04972 [Colletotrichum chlorophyti]|uniref:Uncharacterized protein n=1 Tax=Colletotrichum chlorophyti TaxID=708187 RepID=A0A1Q8S2J0_9PEZI|nr:hypothetical protein CCHL11_04972 [Colletotrichum chlorophyti]
MSSTTLTASERLAIRKWADSMGAITPTIPRTAEWIKHNFGKDVSESTIRDMLNRSDRMDGFKTYDDGELGPLIRPGFGRHITAMPEHGTFPSAVVHWTASTLTYSELAMMWFIDQITDKPDWHVKAFNQDIVSKWKTEVMAVVWPAVGLKHARFDDDMFDWCISELREKAKLYQATGLIPVLDASAAVVKSDTAIPHDIQEALRKGVSALEDVPEQEKDWHPGSDGKVLDLVHPSLWPLVYGLSRILPDRRIPLKDTLKACGTGQVLPTPEHTNKNPNAGQELWSTKFQWLPCDVDIEDGKPVIVSYINNLHPHHHAGLYDTIGKVIAKALPLLDVVYRWPEDFGTLRVHCPKVGRTCSAKCQDWCRPENRPQDPGETARTTSDDETDYDSEADPNQREVREKDKIWFLETHPVMKPKVPEYEGMNLQATDVNLKSGFFGGRERIQVIVKLANIHLTPENPKYGGGSWHIEGQLNEHICATALYYYDNDNITDSRLAFRTTADREDLSLELRYEQDDHYSIGRTFKIDSQGDTNQDLGSVLTREGRLLAFPNVYQHCVAPFELAEKTRPGHRKILALFLVDPAIPIISTANVPPQQRHWWKQVATPHNRIGPLPPEITEMVLDNMEFPIGLNGAKKIREELMKERTAIGEAMMSEISNSHWNFCEH